ncbi:hypothetical protein PHYPSEUDO_003654 [Phytophthora pseudosyringae]|uniref:RxLR effector protein n=1 Tax=Phytophthora pseudosyringae TaxID=221518 RepID=A0A8T1V481_9STRA|nr:hypothetical protein PHYPSEUDO_003654 [Phytophthora pseudosyringae]
MRISYVLLVAAAAATTLLGNGDAAATESGRSTKVSAMASPDVAVSIGTGQGTAGEKRFLRYHGNENRGEEEGDEDDDDDEEEEERAAKTNLFSASKLDEMLDGTKVMSRFKRWKRYGYTTYNLPGAVQSSKYDDLRKLYRKFLYHN